MPNVEAYLRNIDLLELLGADIILARFGGVELDSGTVVEFAIAKSLGKPMLILRSDFRRLYSTCLNEPYNLMVKNWPRTVEVRLDSYRVLAGLLAEERQALAGSDTSGAMIKAELGEAQKSVDYIANQVIDGLETVIEMASPYPPEYQETVYQALRFSPGSGFDDMLTTDDLDEIVQRLRENGTLQVHDTTLPYSPQHPAGPVKP